MSGTSLDGVDVCLCRFENKTSLSYEILQAETIAYTDAWKTRLKDAIHLSGEALIRLHHEYGNFLGHLVLDFMRRNGIDEPVVIGSHGHTVHHRPDEAFTFQAGHGGNIAHITGMTCVYDFRTQDMILGGRGAPLVPIGDRLLFGDYNYHLNLGGFSNISFENSSGTTIGCDLTSVNTVLNHYASKAGYSYDEGGKMARSGRLIPELLDSLGKMRFYQNPCNALGIENVHSEVLPLIEGYHLSPKNILRTYTEHIAMEIGKHLDKGTCLVTGGGAYNDFLMERLREHSKAQIILPDKALIDYKEALIFALLAKLRLQNEVNVLASVTGARHDHSSGIIAFAKLLR